MTLYYVYVFFVKFPNSKLNANLICVIFRGLFKKYREGEIPYVTYMFS